MVEVEKGVIPVVHTEIDHLTRECIEATVDCHNVCLETTTYCLNMGGMHVEAEHLRLLFDCAEICQQSANLMLSRSHYDRELCSVCAVACDACVESCSRFQGDERMLLCADSCRKCADKCRAMVKGRRAA